LAQDLELESLCSGAGHSQVVKDRPTANDSGSRDCVKLASPTAVSRIIPNGIETILLPCLPEHTHISSTLVYEVASYGQSVKGLVPDGIEEVIHQKIDLSY